MSRSVLVTGGNRGIGLAIARAFVDAGDQVAITYRSGEPPEGFLAVRCDITDPEQVERAYKEIEEKHGPVEVLVANAGVTRDQLLLRMSEEDFSTVLETNLTGTFRVVKRASKRMLRARKGRIVLISSVVGLLGSAGQANYAASKAGLVGLARSLARELGSRSITVNVIAPGPVATDFSGGIIRDTPEFQEHLTSLTPLGRIAVADDIGAAIANLLRPGNGWITGQRIEVSGGIHV